MKFLRSTLIIKAAIVSYCHVLPVVTNSCHEPSHSKIPPCDDHQDVQESEDFPQNLDQDDDPRPHVEHQQGRPVLGTGFMIRPIISILGMLIIPSLPHQPRSHHHRLDRQQKDDVHQDQYSHLSLPNVADPGAGRDPFKDPKDSDILSETARYTKD